MADVTFRQLEYFIATADAGSVSAAAQRLHISQSAVSMAIAALERTLGVQLFLRQPRGVTLTREAHNVLGDARRLTAGIADLRNSTLAAQASLTGSLKVGCYSTLSPLLLPRIVDEFVNRHPEIDLSFEEGSHVALEEQLRAGRLDLAILYDYSTQANPAPRDLTFEPIMFTTPYVLLHPGHRLAAKDKISLRDLVDEPLILFTLAPAGDYFLSLFADAGLEPTIRFRTASFELARAMVARHLGYAILSQHTVIDVSYEDLPFATRQLSGSHRGLAVNVVTPAGMQPTRRTRAFIDQCRLSWAGNCDLNEA